MPNQPRPRPQPPLAAQQEPDPNPTEQIGRHPATQQRYLFRVHVRRGLANAIVIECNHPLPVLSDLIPHFTTAELRDTVLRRSNDYGYNNYQIDRIASICINDYHWFTMHQLQDALCAYLLHLFSTVGAPDDPEPAVLTPFNQPAYLTIANHLYRLQPTAEVTTTRALQGLRRRVTAEARDEAAAIRAAATANADALMGEATRRMSAASDAMAQAARGANIPPQWAIPRFRCFYSQRNSRWEVGFNCSIHFTDLEYKWIERTLNPTTQRFVETHKFKRWHLLDAPSFPVLMWQPIATLPGANQQLLVTGCHLDSTSPLLPHMNWVSACMTIADAPLSIDSVEAMGAYIQSVERCMSVIDYTSPFTCAQDWAPCIRAFIPPALMAALTRDGDHVHNNLVSDQLAANEFGDHANEDRQVFRAA